MRLGRCDNRCGTICLASCLATAIAATVVFPIAAAEPAASRSTAARPASAAATTARRPTNAAGLPGGAQGVDFQSLIDLITQTVAPTTWQDLGGEGTISPYPSGVCIDAGGRLHRTARQDLSGRLRQLGLDARPVAADGQPDPHRPAPLRKVSLARLSRHAKATLARGDPLDEPLRCLAGLVRVQYVIALPDAGELLLAGPAEDWSYDEQGRARGRQSGRPVVLLDDLVALWRQAKAPGGPFGCLITPRQESLAAAQAWLDAAPPSLRPNQRRAWLEELRQRVGTQDIEVFGIDPGTHVAQTLVEADYHMKLVGLGLAERPPGLADYLDLLARHGDAAEPLEVLRWWFTLADEPPLAGADGRVFELPQRVVRLCSENELLNADGSRVHTHRAAPLNAQFAQEFTAHFAEIAAAHPVYAELENVCQLACAVALIGEYGLADDLDWPDDFWNGPETYRLAATHVPQTVETVMSSRVVGGRRIIAAVSGGVKVDLREALEAHPPATDGSGRLDELGRQSDSPPDDARWWWDWMEPQREFD